MDTVIENCTVYIGDGSIISDTNIGIKGEKIAYIGNEKLDARYRIDAKGLVVAPGFIDIHNHTDLELISCLGDDVCYEKLDYRDKKCHNYVAQGVTTIFTGNCGQGFASIDRWSNLLGEKSFGLNIGHFIPYSSIRIEELGKKHEEKFLCKDSIAKLCRRIETEMEKGAFGLSVSFDSPPGCYATTDELIEYARILKKYNGVYVTHIRNESGVGIIDSINEAVKIGRTADIRVHLSQFRIYKPTLGITSEQISGAVSDARKNGLNISASQNPYNSIYAPLGEYFIGHLLSNIDSDIDYEDLKDDNKLVKAFEKIINAFSADSIIITSCIQYPDFEGKNIEDIANIENKDPVEIMKKLYLLNPSPLAIVFAICKKTMEELMCHDFVYTSSNGALCIHGEKKHHPRSFGTFPKKLGFYSLKAGLMSLNDAICSMTSKPAEFFNIKNRGMIKEGYYADITIFNESTIKDIENYLNPNQYSKGIQYVLVNGKLVFENESLTDKIAGALIFNQ